MLILTSIMSFLYLSVQWCTLKYGLIMGLVIKQFSPASISDTLKQALWCFIVEVFFTFVIPESVTLFWPILQIFSSLAVQSRNGTSLSFAKEAHSSKGGPPSPTLLLVETPSMVPCPEPTGSAAGRPASHTTSNKDAWWLTVYVFCLDHVKLVTWALHSSRCSCQSFGSMGGGVVSSGLRVSVAGDLCGFAYLTFAGPL